MMRADMPRSLERPGGAAAPTRGRLIQVGFQALGIGTFYLLILAFFAFATPFFLTYSNALNVLTNVSVIGIVALGQALAIISGGFDLSVSGTLPLGAVLFALLTNAGLSPWPAMLAVIAIGAGVGLINGLIVTKLKINPLITTLGTLSIGAGLAYTASSGVTIPFANLDAGWLADRPMAACRTISSPSCCSASSLSWCCASPCSGACCTRSAATGRRATSPACRSIW